MYQTSKKSKVEWDEEDWEIETDSSNINMPLISTHFENTLVKDKGHVKPKDYDLMGFSQTTRTLKPR